MANSTFQGKTLTEKRGLLLVGHGSREPFGLEEFLATSRLVAEMAGSVPIESAFLEFANPMIAVGLRNLVHRGVRRVTVVPLLLFAAGHAKRDIPAAVAAAAAEHAEISPAITVEQTDHLGCHEALVELSQLRYDEALATLSPVSADETALVMVGRGSHDREAIAEMRQFVELRQRITPAALMRTAFLAMAEPRLETVLDEVVGLPVRRIVVQPHLLFGGVLLERIAALVEKYARWHPNIQWVTPAHLGPSRLVAQAALDRAGLLHTKRARDEPLGGGRPLADCRIVQLKLPKQLPPISAD